MNEIIGCVALALIAIGSLVVSLVSIGAHVGTNRTESTKPPPAPWAGLRR